MQNKKIASVELATRKNTHKDNIHKRLNFKQINRSAMFVLPSLLNRWLPSGKKIGKEWVALNPCRLDRNLGSFRINLRTGQWADFSTGDKGGDVISLAAYLGNLTQYQAAKRLSAMLGGSHD